MSISHRALATLFGTAGVLHFLHPEPFDSMVPPELPGTRRFYTYASGVAEVGTAVLLANPSTRRLGGTATALLSLGVWPGNFHMAWLWRRKPWYWQLVSLGRLPLQIPLITSGWKIRQGK